MVTKASIPGETLGNLKTSFNKNVFTSPSPPGSSVKALLKSKTVSPPQAGCALIVVPCSIVSNSPSLSSSKSHPSGTKSPSASAKSLNPSHWSAELITPSPSQSFVGKSKQAPTTIVTSAVSQIVLSASKQI